MPSSPKIKKEDMLKTALDIVMESGYSALNIKEVAKRLGCSTAPISWQFGGMDGLRTELIPFAEQYVEEEYYRRKEAVDELSAFELRGRGTIELALDKPMLFQFLYMGDRSQLLSAGFYYGASVKDLAMEFGYRENQMAQRMMKLRKKLRVFLIREG